MLSGAQAELDPIWVVAGGRAFGLVAVTLPVALAGRLPRPRPADPAVRDRLAGARRRRLRGACWSGSQDGVAVPAVLSTLSAVFLALVGYFFFRERISRLQWAGALTTLAGVATLAATR